MHYAVAHTLILQIMCADMFQRKLCRAVQATMEFALTPQAMSGQRTDTF